MATADAEPGARPFTARPTTGDQARGVRRGAQHGLRASRSSRGARFGVTVGKHDITVPTTASSAKPLNAEGSTLDG